MKDLKVDSIEEEVGEKYSEKLKSFSDASLGKEMLHYLREDRKWNWHCDLCIEEAERRKKPWIINKAFEDQ